MSLAAPGWIGLAAVASLAIVAIHLIAWRLPRTVVLPTTRFVPDEPARRAARTIRLADVALLALRVSVVMLGGLAMARPVLASRPAGAATVIAIATAVDSAARTESLRAIPRGGRTVFVIFDTTARTLDEPSAQREAPRGNAHSLTVGLLAAIREARRLENDHDTVRIALVAPFARGSFDNATSQVRSLWPDSIRMIRTPLVDRSATPARVEFVASGDDPVVAGIRLAQANRLIRGVSVVVREGSVPPPDSGKAIVVWPRTTPNEQERADAVYATGMTAIGTFMPMSPGDSGRVIAWWVNGTPAAREVSRPGGCVRSVGFDVADAGDFVLTPAFQRLAAELLAPCGGDHEKDSVPDSVIAALSSPPTGSRPLPRDASQNRVAAILMVLAMMLGLTELLVRRSAQPVLAERAT